MSEVRRLCKEGGREGREREKRRKKKPGGGIKQTTLVIVAYFGWLRGTV